MKIVGMGQGVAWCFAMRYASRMATLPIYPLVGADDFLEMDFGDYKAELDNGAIRMMAGGTRRHAEVTGNIFVALANRLRGSGCKPYNSDMAARTHDLSIRYPDVAVYCGREGPEHDEDKSADDPRVIFEVLSAGTARTDLTVKLAEYKALPSVDAIVFVDIATERLRVVALTAPDTWTETQHREPVDLVLPSLNATVPHDEIFARG
jgi:Uma2 family endonuclease